MRNLLILFLVFVITSAHAEVIKGSSYALLGAVKYKDNFDHFDYVNPTAPKRGKVIYSFPATFDSLNRYILKGNKAPGLEITQDSLMKSSLDELYGMYGLIAESIEYSSKKDWVIYNLRKEARWHDGKPITAEDVKFTFDILRSEGDPNYKIVLADIDEIKVLTPTRVKFTIKNPKNMTIISLISTQSILPKHFFEGKKFDKYDKEPVLGSSAYKIKSFQFGKSIEYERVKDYWAENLNVNRGFNNFDYVQYDVYLDQISEILALKAGEVDFRSENYSKMWATAYNIEQIKDGSMIKELVEHKLPASLQSFFLNTRRSDLADRNVREALTLAFDFDWLNKNLFYGLYTRTQSYYENTFFQARGTPSVDELKLLEPFKNDIPKEVFEKEFRMPRTHANIVESRENLKRARQLLLDSGYVISGDGLISPYTKKPLELELIYRDDAFDRMLNFYVKNLAKIGIKLKLHKLDDAQAQLRTDKFDYDITTISFAPVTIPGISETQVWNSAARVEGGYNFSGVNSKAIDFLTKTLSDPKDTDELIAAAKALDRILLYSYYSIPHFYSKNFRLVYWNKFGVPAKRPDYDVGNSTWWLK